MAVCHYYHHATGMVTTHPDGLPPMGAFMSVVSCDRPYCIRAWKGTIRRTTGLASTFMPFTTRRQDTA